MNASSISPHMTLAFAQTYETTATRITGPIAHSVLQRLGAIGRGTRLLDIGAGSGALTVPAAHSGAHVTAVDIAPGMVELLNDRLNPFPDADAFVMDGQALDFDDGAFDIAVSILGVSLFQDWRRGLAEQIRVVRPGGIAALATWRTLPGGGPFLLMARAMRTVFPDRPAPPAPEGFVALSDPLRMERALLDTGLREVRVEEIEAEWKGVAGPAYIDALRDLHGYMPSYAALRPDERGQVEEAILSLVDEHAVDGQITLKTQAVVAIGSKA